MLSSIRFDMRAPADGPASAVDLYRATLDMAAWADRVGIGSVVLSEHHGAEDGFLPSPVVAAAAIAGRTERITITIGALLLPLHDPLRVAEDLAVLDLLSGGRVTTILGLGYREEEYEMFGAPWEDRGAHFDACIEALLEAWTGEPFQHRGHTVRVTPRPGTDLRRSTFIGGRSRRAARRAARFGMPFFPDSGDPVLREEYERSCRELGRPPGLVISPEPQVHYLFVSEDPDGYWDRIGPHLLHEALTYGSWQPAGSRSSAATDATTIDELRAGDLFNVLRPDDAVRWATGRPVLLVYPLCGGIPPEVAWESLSLLEHEVLPRLEGARGR